MRHYLEAFNGSTGIGELFCAKMQSDSLEYVAKDSTSKNKNKKWKKERKEKHLRMELLQGFFL
jgi:hypothetical protein